MENPSEEHTNDLILKLVFLILMLFLTHLYIRLNDPIQLFVYFSTKLSHLI